MQELNALAISDINVGPLWDKTWPFGLTSPRNRPILLLTTLC